MLFNANQNPSSLWRFCDVELTNRDAENLMFTRATEMLLVVIGISIMLSEFLFESVFRICINGISSPVTGGPNYNFHPTKSRILSKFGNNAEMDLF